MNRAVLQRAAVRRMSQALAGRLRAQEMNQIVVEEAVRLTEATSAALCLLVGGSDQLDFVTVAGGNARQIVGLRIRVADSISQTVLASGEPAILDSRQLVGTGDLFGGNEKDEKAERASALNPPVEGRAGKLTIRSAAVVPLFDNGRIVGTLVAQNKGSDQNSALFDQEDLDILSMLGDFASLALEASRSAAIACDQSRELAVLYDAAQSVAGNLNVQQVLDNVLTALCAHIEYHSAVLFLLNDERTHLFIAAERGLSEEERDVQLSVEIGAHTQSLITASRA